MSNKKQWQNNRAEREVNGYGERTQRYIDKGIKQD